VSRYLWHRRWFLVTGLLLSVAGLPTAAYAAPASQPSPTFAYSLPATGALQARGVATVLAVQVKCPRKADQAFVDASLTQATSAGVQMQFTDAVFAPCTGSDSTVHFMLGNSGILTPGPAQLSIDFSYLSNHPTAHRQRIVSLAASVIDSPAIHSVHRVANGAALAIKVTLPCRVDGDVTFLGDVNQRLTTGAQSGQIRSTIACHRPSVTRVLYAIAPTSPWSLAPAALTVERSCVNLCRHTDLLGSSEVTP
jgi:hypothetical protein